MKVKLINEGTYSALENEINYFIEDKQVINISISEVTRSISALILYEDNNEDENYEEEYYG